MNHKTLKVKYKNNLFYIKISEEIFSVYLEMIGCGTANPDEFTLNLAFYNLSNMVMLALKQVFNEIKLNEIMHTEPNLDSDEIFELILQCGELANVKIFIFGNNIEEIQGIYYTKSLNLEQIASTLSLKEHVYNKYALEFTPKYLHHFSEEKFVRGSFSFNNKIENIYFKVSLANFIYNTYYPNCMPFTSDSYHLAIISNLINLWLRLKLKLSNLTVLSTAVTFMPVNKYSVLLIEDLSEKIFFEDNSIIVSQLKNKYTKEKASKEEAEPADFLLPKTQKISVSVLKYIFNLSLKQLKSLKVNDIVLLTKHESKNNDFLYCKPQKYIKYENVGENKIKIKT